MQDSLNKTSLGDLSNLEQDLAQDEAGTRADALEAWFDDVAMSVEQQLKTASDELQRQHLARLIEGARASQRIVRHAWEALHRSAAA